MIGALRHEAQFEPTKFNVDHSLLIAGVGMSHHRGFVASVPDLLVPALQAGRMRTTYVSRAGQHLGGFGPRLAAAAVAKCQLGSSITPYGM